MNKSLFFLLLGVLSFGVVAKYCDLATADKSLQVLQRWKEPILGFTNVEQAKALPDDTWVILEGRLNQPAGDGRHEFHDASGSIYVDITKNHWQGQVIAPTDRVFIEGEVKRNREYVEINVNKLFVVK
ncbi:NirD/YgiW/YdeI family stress tolerance protein [Serratia ureilytica]|uniref:YgiW/YdeI family stress tolerance OB fold protein n=1 Tax=Serratia ureilytica TaxID=300181 RepID=UPI001595FD44|nr:NirD/YgiW/YdeI family stress tolerance protein [Serratia ureilytica]MEB5992008.1 NirD/YgiW/YdeI family stress tolerance protein [Serratia ureilytica]